MKIMRCDQIKRIAKLLAVGCLMLFFFGNTSEAGTSLGGGILWQDPSLPIPSSQQGPKGGLWLQPSSPVNTGQMVWYTAHANQPAFGHLYAVNASGRVDVLARNYPLGMNYGYGQQGMLRGNLVAVEPSGRTEFVLLLTYGPLNEAALQSLAASQGRSDYVSRLNAVLAQIAKGKWSTYLATSDVYSQTR